MENRQIDEGNKGKAQPVEFAPHIFNMVPKPGFEPGQAFTH